MFSNFRSALKSIFYNFAPTLIGIFHRRLSRAFVLCCSIDDDGFILWESNAIVRYLARKHSHGKLSPADPQAYASADRWMDWQQTTLGSTSASTY